MTISVKHNFHSAKADGVDTTLVQPSNWNDDHAITLGTGKVMGRMSAGSGTVEELATTGTGSVVMSNSPALVTPNLGTPSAGTLTNCTMPVGGLTGLGLGVAAHLADNLPFPSTTDTLVGTKKTSTTVSAGGSLGISLPNGGAGFAVISAFHGTGYSTWFVGWDDANGYVGVVLFGKAQAAGSVDPIASVVGNNAGDNSMTITCDSSSGNVTIGVKLIPLVRN